MADRESRLINLVTKARAGLESVPDTLRDTGRTLREDPRVIWSSPIVRIGGWCLLGLVAIAGFQWLIAGITPGGAAPLGEKPTALATLYVACSSPACRTSYMSQQPMNFQNWPLKCESCGLMSIYRAERCERCSAWIARSPGNAPSCPRCEARDAATRPVPTSQRIYQHADDAEDGW